MTRLSPSAEPRASDGFRRAGRWGVVAWCSALLTAPLLLMLVGLRPAAIENRAPAPAPPFSAARLFDTDWYSGIAVWFSDRLPGRDRAIAADAAIDLRILGESPNPEVILGTDGWLYYRYGTEEPCYGDARVRAALGEIDTAERALAAAGIRLLLVVAPNKDALYPEYLGGGIDTACTRADRAAFRSAAAVSGPESARLDTWAVLEREKEAGRGPLYYRLDSHWTSLGAGTVAGALLERIDPGTWDPAEFVPVGAGRHRGDLADLIGLPLDEEETLWVTRPGATLTLVTEGAGTRDEAIHSQAPGPGTIAGETLLLHDSVGIPLAPLLRPYFESLTTAGRVGVAGTARPWLSEQLARTDLLIVVGVERLVVERLEAGLAGNLVAAVSDLLPHREVPLEPGMAGAEQGTRWMAASGRIATTGPGEATIPLPSLAPPAVGGEQYLLVEVILKQAAQVSLTWEGPDGEALGASSRRLVKGEAAVAFRLPANVAVRQYELHISQGEGHRVARLALVEVPPGEPGS
jgi:alginate O-acetyltransferase complex protein AlgJ